MTFLELLTAFLSTPAGMALAASFAGLLLHGIGVKIPALSPALDALAAALQKLLGGATPTPAPGPGPNPSPAPLPPIGQGGLLALLLQVGTALLQKKAANAVLSPEEKAALVHVGAAIDLHK